MDNLDESLTANNIRDISSGSKTAVATQSNIQLEVEQVPGDGSRFFRSLSWGSFQS